MSAALLAAHGGDAASAAYRPMLAAYTHEDREAKGLRKLTAAEAPPPPVHFTALELAAEYPLLLLTAPAGAGKTSFALDLALALAGEALGDPLWNVARLTRMVVRNDLGHALPEQWQGPVLAPVYRALTAGETVAPTDMAAGRLLILDNVEVLGEAALAALIAQTPAGARLLALGETGACAGWALPEAVAVHALVPSPAGWHGQSIPAADADTCDAALAAWRRGDRRRAPHLSQWPRAAQVARALAEMPAATIAAHFAGAPDLWWLPVTLAADLVADRAALAGALAATGPHGAVLGAAIHRKPEMIAALCAAATGATLPAHLRVAAGRHMAALGDPRNLAELVTVPAGTVAIGSDMHPNSLPLHSVVLAGFRIGRWPVGNGLYGAFAAATGRPWRSPDANVAERANAPATDLTWHDARAFCTWLTGEWRNAGRIADNESVRLPTEPEWEYAARGDRPHTPGCEIYPYPGPWAPDRANALEAGFNATTPVGLFPAGASPFGAEDMAGQVWEWTSTLWGRDPATPDFAWPWRAETHEDPDAPADVRRVLRGGCFSSHRGKANCTYRGSLEPHGFWRGNGFRIVVAPVEP